MSSRSEQTYKFIIDCHGKYCTSIQKHMKNAEFQVSRDLTPIGDHYGLKSFKTKKEAENAASELFDRFNKNSRIKKLYRVTLKKYRG